MKLEDIPMKMLGDYEINQILEKEENIGLIEELLHSKKEELEKIRDNIGKKEKVKAKLLGKSIVQEEFDAIYDDISSRVNAFLGVDGIRRPQFVLSELFSNLYDSKIELMFLNSKHRTELIVSGSHEYTHHVCKVNGIYIAQNCFAEGICRAAQREVAKQYSIEENNMAFMLGITELDVGELKSMYIWLAEKFEKPVYSGLIGIETDIDSFENKCRIKSGNPTIHARGNVLYMLKEKEQGKEFYSRIF